MITQDKLQTVVEFGSSGNASVGLTARSNKLIIQELNKQAVIGNELTKGDVNDIPSITMNFYDANSIDALIKCLERVKHNMEFPYPSYCYAC